jgi:hypothetical protein
MNINWEKIDEYTQSIYVDGIFIGQVKSTLLTQQWSMHPSFWSGKAKQDIFYKKFPSCYECGKAMAKLYETSYDYPVDPWDEYEIDDLTYPTNGVFGKIKP